MVSIGGVCGSEGISEDIFPGKPLRGIATDYFMPQFVRHIPGGGEQRKLCVCYGCMLLPWKYCIPHPSFPHPLYFLPPPLSLSFLLPPFQAETVRKLLEKQTTKKKDEEKVRVMARQYRYLHFLSF